MEPQRELSMVVALLSVLFLGACSSGGGGGSGLSTAPVQITEENSEEVAAGVPMTAALIDFQEFMGFQTLTSQGTGTVACPDGGSITASFVIDEPPVGQVSTGDRFAASFDDCMLDPSSHINGGIAIDFNTIVGNWQLDDEWEVDIGFTIDDLRFSSGPATGTFDGSWTQEVTYASGDAEYSLAGSFTTTVNDGSGREAAALDDLVLSWSHDALAEEATYSVEGRFASTQLGGSVTLATLTPFKILDTEIYPHEGVVTATGAGDSRLTFTVLDETYVQIDIDADGDGIDEITLTTTWFDLEE